MKVLVTGANGQLGTDLVKVLADEHDVYGAKKEDLNISDLEKVLQYFEAGQFDIVINAAAYTNVDRCETDFENAFRVNAIGPRNLAVAAQKFNFRLVHISTDYVFSGEKPEGYLEFDEKSPVNKYGLSKYAGEEYLKNHCSNFFIVRTSWLYGKHGNNFVKTMLKLAETKNELKVVDDQIGSPTYTLDLAEFIVQLVKTEKYGIYHFSNSGSCSWNEFAKEIFKQAGLEVNVLPISTEDYNSPALRPKFSILKNVVGELEFGYRARSWQDALKRYFEEVKK